MERWDDRTRLLLGNEGMARLALTRVLVVGVGGVGGYAAEMLVRSGIGMITIVDADTVAETNLNRQLIALRQDIGKPKVELFAERFRRINPEVQVDARMEYVTEESAAHLVAEGYDYVVDAIDTVAPKVALVAECLRTRTPIVSSMGAGGRIDPTKVGFFDLWETREDGLARAVRQRLKKMGLRKPLAVVASTEAPRRSSVIELNDRNKRSSYGTLATIPSLFGIFLANKVIYDRTQKHM